MTTVLLGFVVTFVLVLASICALVVVRMLGNGQSSNRSTGHRSHSRLHRDRHFSAHRSKRAV